MFFKRKIASEFHKFSFLLAPYMYSFYKIVHFKWGIRLKHDFVCYLVSQLLSSPVPSSSKAKETLCRCVCLPFEGVCLEPMEHNHEQEVDDV